MTQNPSTMNDLYRAFMDNSADMSGYPYPYPVRAGGLRMYGMPRVEETMGISHSIDIEGPMRDFFGNDDFDPIEFNANIACEFSMLKSESSKRRFPYGRP